MKKKKIIITIFLSVALFIFFNNINNISAEGECRAAGGNQANCFTKCPANYEEVSAGNPGCVVTVGHICCKPITAAGASGAGSGILPTPTGGKGGDGDYSLNDFIQLAVNVSEKILGLVGSLALLAFVYGGIMFLISGGNSEKVEKGKQILIGAVVGLVIVFTSYMIIQFTMSALGVTGNWAKTGWFK